MNLDEILASGEIPHAEKVTDSDFKRLVWKCRGLLKDRERDQAYWAATNANLQKAYDRLDEQDRELSKAYDIIRQDLLVASQIQGNLLPDPPGLMKEELEIGVFHRQLAEVGGDYYDYFITRSGGYAIGVFDISGHGVSAALVMTYLKAQFMSVLERLESPKEIVDWVNGVSISFLRKIRKYATVNFIIFHNQILRYVSGGGFGLIKSGDEIRTFEKRDQFLGLRPHAFHEYQLEFKKGDLLALYTDGIIEAKNNKYQDYTKRRLNELIVQKADHPVDEIIEACKDDYYQFREKDSDDITLIVMRKRR